MVNLRLSFFELPYLKGSESNFSENNQVLPEKCVLMYSKIFFKFKIQVFKKMPKQKCMR